MYGESNTMRDGEEVELRAGLEPGGQEPSNDLKTGFVSDE